MEQVPRSNDGFANPNLFADSQQYNAYDSLFPPAADQTAYEASWGINASTYPAQSRAPNPAAPNWPHHANHPSQPNIPGQATPYARSLSQSPVTYGPNAFSAYGPPQNFQYRQHQPDPAFDSPHAFNPHLNYSTTDYQIPNAGTVAPHALQQEQRSPAYPQVPHNAAPYTASHLAPLRPGKPAAPETVNQAKLIAAIPAAKNGGRFSIVNFDDLSKHTTSERMSNFVNIGTEPLHWDITRAALPAYQPRRSRNELRKLAANDPKLLARLGKTATKKTRALAPLSKPQAKAASPTAERIRFEGESPSEDESSSESDDDSSYTSEEEVESAPLPDKRPDSPKDATEYDTIKALWRGKRKAVASDSIRKGLGAFWDIVKTIRDRWKLDVGAVQDAEAKNRTSELPLLQSRVKDQRDMLEVAFKTALKHGHRAILELMSENVPLLYLCYQFLLDRTKAEDFNGPLSRVMLETISLFTTVTDQKLEQTHMVKVLPRFIKKGDAKTQFYAKRIVANAAALTKEKAGDTAAKKPLANEGNAPSPPAKKKEPEQVAGVKRPASAADTSQTQKKVATEASKVIPVKQSAVAKNLPTGVDGAKATPATTTAATKTKQVTAKPSGLFASLQSAAKKPGTSNASRAAQLSSSKPADKGPSTKSAPSQQAAPQSTFSFAETMANLSKPKEEKPVAKPEKQETQETPEQRAKRLRKESRRHLRVSFKNDENLVEVREFYHDPDEELGHDASQVRDLSDVGGEGRMFKQQHNMMDVDDEDEVPEEDPKLIEFVPPTPIDFSVIDSEDRQRNYAKYGGGELQPESPEHAAREAYEAKTLMIFYPDPKDVPLNPREPADPYNGEPVTEYKTFGKPTTPARQPSGDTKIGGLPAQSGAVFSSAQNSYQPGSQPTAPSSDAISNILASLKQAQFNQNNAAAPAMGGFGSAFTPQPPAPIPSGQPDLAAILAQIQQNQAAGAAAPAPATTNYGLNTANPFQAPTMSQQQNSALFENPERKQWREGGSGDGNGENAGKGKNQPAGLHPNYRTKVCKYWQEGRCQKGEQCSYKHEE